MRRLAPALFALLVPFAPARAMNFELAADGNALQIVATGAIVPGDSAKLRATVDRVPPRTPISGVRISSLGGSIAEADVLAKAIRATHLPVTVASGADCASACFLIFAAATERYVGHAARIGVHSASINGQESSAAMAVTTEVARRASAWGVPPEIIGKLVTTGPKQITWLSAADLASMGAVEAQ